MLLSKGKRRQFLAWNVALIVAQTYVLVPPLGLSAIVNYFANYRPGQSLDDLFAFIALLVGSAVVVSFLRLGAKTRLGEIDSEIIYLARMSGFQKLVDNSLRWHDSENTGNKVQRIETGLNAFQRIMRIFARDMYRIILAAIGAYLTFILLGWDYALIVTVYCASLLGIHLYFAAILRQLYERKNKLKEASSGKYFEGLNNLLTVKTLGAKNSITNQIQIAEKELLDLAKTTYRLNSTKWLIFSVLSSASRGIIFVLAAINIANGKLTIGALILMLSYIDKLHEAMTEGAEYWDELIELRQGFLRMLPIFEAELEIYSGTKEFPRDWQELKVENLNFTYTAEEEKLALNHVSFSLKRGQKIGIAGRSGSGKSTFSKLLLQLYRPESGDIKIGNDSLYDISNDEVTNHISVVLQESELFNFSLLENITLLQPLNEAKLKIAIEVAQLEGLLEKLPDGVNTLVGEKGYRVSGGERQRIAIARAVYKGAQILILDEATSHLDGKTEAAIQRELEHQLPETTMIIIAHRLSTLSNTDKIYVFAKGEIVETGNYTNLVANKNSHFNELMKVRNV